MKVEFVIKTGWDETKVSIDGYKFDVEKVVEAIKKTYSEASNQYLTEIK